MDDPTRDAGGIAILIALDSGQLRDETRQIAREVQRFKTSR